MNALERYFKETGDNPAQLAERIGRSPSTITRALKGERNVSMDVARDVERGTGGRITAADFLAICLAARPADEAGPEPPGDPPSFPEAPRRRREGPDPDPSPPSSPRTLQTSSTT